MTSAQTRNLVSSQPSDKAEIQDFTIEIESSVTANESIKILKHGLSTRSGNASRPMPCVELAIRNISDTTIASMTFETTFFDKNGGELERNKHIEVELKSQTSRSVMIACSKIGAKKPEYYQVHITKMTGSEVEKVQLRQHEIITIEDGREEARGIVKNISDSITNAALVANYFNDEMEKIGSKVIIMRGIEPEGIKEFYFCFKPSQGDHVMSYSLSVVCDLVEI